ncbi:hypothetical protein KW548_24840 [Vibrio neptunius]|nr:hypothetical protein [Vibrio neptunius]QXX09528.1 hypothetical protein KW548_24840 [Vibrio neptunius]
MRVGIRACRRLVGDTQLNPWQHRTLLEARTFYLSSFNHYSTQSQISTTDA